MRNIKISIKEVKDCCGKPTVEVTYGGYTASAPSGTSVGRYEKPPFRNTIPKEISAFKKIIPLLQKIKIEEFNDFKKIEQSIKKFGANTIIALEYAILKSKGGYKFLGGRKIPTPLGNCIGGGAHGGALDFQEFLVMDAASKTMQEKFFNNMKAHKILQQELKLIDKTFSNQTTIEGAWAPNISNEQALSIVQQVAKKLGLKYGIDIAASTFWNERKYKYRDKTLTREQQIDYVNQLIQEYTPDYVEDPLEQNDFDGFSQLKQSKCLICGDDLTVTNPERFQKALDFHSINAIIIKPNQIGSLIKTKQVIDTAKKNHITPVISHRSRETLDNTLAHLAVGFEIPIMKIGIIGRERTEKIKELIRIEKEIKK